MKCICVIEECMVILCPEHARNFEQAAEDADKDCWVMELEDYEVGFVQCAACEVIEKLGRAENQCH